MRPSLRKRLKPLLTLILALAANSAVAAEDVLEEVVVTATLRQQSLVQAPVSVTVLDERALRDAGRQHFEDVLTSVPNLHYSGGTSRPRFFQLRGIGEREEYQGAPNPSVGFLIDDIDFSGIGMPATLFDVERIEVLRGPQGLHYGANALGGLIVMRGRDPEDEFGFATEASVGEYDSRSIAAVATGPVEALNSAWRVSVQNFRSDGYRDNAYLRRDDTMGRDELTSRVKWRWRPSDDTTVDLTWLHADLDNGYDAWSIDNSRRSLADRPGKDAQKADGASLRVDTAAGTLGRLTVTAALSDSDSEYSFDSDWGNAESWAPYTYDFFDRQLRERRGRSLEARLASDLPSAQRGLTWVAGIYGLDVDEQLDSTSVGVYVDPFAEYSSSNDNRVISDYDARNIAIYGQVEAPLSGRWGWSFGLRGEQRDADYSDRRNDSGVLTAIDESERDRMWGGQATLYFDQREQLRWFATVSRGYKAGGFNIGDAAQVLAEFLPEYLVGLDVGVKGQWFEQRLYADVTAFYMKRTDMQIAISTQLDPIGDPSSYLLYTDNASGGRNLGIESSIRWRATEQLEVGGSLGLLRTRYSGFRPDGITEASDRDQAYAPEYQASLNATWRHPLGWMARVDVVAIDDYYFDVPENNIRSDAYSLTHLKAGYEADRWAVYAWSRNLFDEDYLLRGFNFGNEPPDFPTTRYTQLGEPRQFGVTVRWEFK